MLTMVAENTTLISVKNIDMTALGDMGISTNAGCNITVTGDFNKKILGAATEHYAGVFHERWDGNRHTHTGADTFSRSDPGTDHSCPADTRNTPATNCDTVNSIS